AFGVPPVIESAALPAWTEWVALAIAPLAFGILLRAHLADSGWILAAGWVAFTATRAGSVVLGAELGAFAGALAVGMFANLYALFRDRPSQVPLVPGVLLLVPGSIGFRSVNAMLDREVV